MIRQATLKDAEAILAIYGPYIKDTAVSFETEVPSLAEFQARMRKVLESYPWLVFEEGGHVVGYAYASTHSERAAYQWSVNVSVYVSQKVWKKGIGKALYQDLLSRLTTLGYYNAFGGITLPNPGSVGLHEKLGFKPVGIYKNVGFKLDQWHDVGWWQLELKRADARPETPASL